MAWASKAVRSDCYVIAAGDDESSPVTSYEPGKILIVHVRVKCYGMLFRGIQMYAVNSNEEKVGDWEISNAEPTEFKRPWESADHPCYGTLMHSSAEYKPYHSILYFKTPPAGTGPITFRTLIKYGNANTGAFYWPKEDIVLSEAAPQPLQTTFYKTSAIEQSCTELCQETEGYGCDESALVNIQNPSRFSDEFLDETICVLPLISGCGDQSGVYDPVNQFCYYPEGNCVAQNRTPATLNCDTKVIGGARFCACTYGVNDEMSAADSLRGTSALVVLALFFLNPRLAMLLLALLGLSSAHNWINSLSRSNGASTYSPFKPPVSDMPHAQVGPGQAFQAEWMTAHGGFTYFAIVHIQYQEYMKQINAKLLDNYIKLAPANAFTNASEGIYQRLHRKDNNTLDNDFPASSTTPTKFGFFMKFVNVSDPLYVARSVSFGGRSPPYLVQYKPADLAQDVRCSYASDLYPWLEAVYKFKMSALQPNRPDVANFWIPGRAGYGRYVVQYVWSGYRDAIDVDYLPDQVANIYGIPPNGTRWKRLDHCLFDNPRAIYDLSEVVTDANYCLRKCAARGSCWGVNVVPLKAPASAYTFAKPDSENWLYPYVYGADIYVPWNTTIFNAWRDQIMSNASSDKYLCYSVQPADFTDTTDEYTISKDPDDPIFYSTCYYKYRGNIFPGYEDTATPSVTPGPWRFYDKCLTCKSQTSSVNATVVPRWEIADKCIDCDFEPSPPVQPFFPQSTVVEVGTRCDGQGGTWSRLVHHNCSSNSTCVQQLVPLGRGTGDSVTLDECYLLASRNPNCSSVFSWAFNATVQRCYCYTNFPCCSSCSRRYDATSVVYELTSTPDPQCNSGTLSSDGTTCCSASCGAGKCVSSSVTGTQVQNGYCCSNCITRPCSQYGPPCKL